MKEEKRPERQVTRRDGPVPAAERAVIACPCCRGWWYEGETPRHWPECDRPPDYGPP